MTKVAHSITFEPIENLALGKSVKPAFLKCTLGTKFALRAKKLFNWGYSHNKQMTSRKQLFMQQSSHSPKIIKFIALDQAEEQIFLK